MRKISKWMKKGNWYYHWDSRDVRMIWPRFKTVIIKMLLPAIAHILETNENRKTQLSTRKSHQRNGREKEEPSRNFQTEKYNNKNFKTSMDDLNCRMEEKESVNWKIETEIVQYQKEKILWKIVNRASGTCGIITKKKSAHQSPRGRGERSWGWTSTQGNHSWKLAKYDKIDTHIDLRSWVNPKQH